MTVDARDAREARDESAGFGRPPGVRVYPTCPAEDELLAFHRGYLPESGLDAVADHLDACPACEALVQSFDARAGSADPLLAVLRKQLTLTRAPNGSRPDPADTPSLPGYEIVGTLGRGGMGVVYKARQVRLNRYVALKRLRSSDPRETSRSRAEAEALARLQHPGVVQIHEFIEHEGGVFLALELVEGGSLAARLGGRPQSPAESAETIEAVARAVHYAHANGIVHRDLKPANILLTGGEPAGGPGGETEAHHATLGPVNPPPYRRAVPKVTDFGIAKQLAAGPGETRAGDVIGTPSYMAPEQAAGSPRIGPAADVYSLGVVLYEMLTGRVPLQGPTPIDTLILVRTADPVLPRQLQPGIPRDLEVVCLKCLEKDPGRRYATAHALADDLARFRQNKPILARPTPAWERTWKAVRRHPVVAALSVALVVVVAVGFGLVAWQWRRAEDRAQAAITAKAEAQENERHANRLSAGIALDRGIALCESGEQKRGLLWLVRALKLAAQVGDDPLERVARCNLAGWGAFVSEKKGEYPHSSWVWAVALSPDARTALTGSKDRTARLWDTTTGLPRTEPLRHDTPVWGVAFSPDGATFATVCGDDDGSGAVRVWETATGRPLTPPLPHPGAVSGVAFSPDGKTILASRSGLSRLWTTDGRPIGGPLAHPPPDRHHPHFQATVTGAFSPDGRLVATGGEDGTVCFWSAATGRPEGAPLLCDSPVLTLAFSPDGRSVMTGCFDGRAQLWDTATRRPSAPALLHRAQVKAVAFSPDGRLVATGIHADVTNTKTSVNSSYGDEAQLWYAATGRPLGPSLPHPAAVWAVAFSPDGRLLMTGCRDAGIRFFLVATGAQMGDPLNHDGNVTAVAFSRDGRLAIGASAGGDRHAAARLWTTPPGPGGPPPILLDGNLLGVQFRPDSHAILTWTGEGDRTIRELDLDGRPLTPSRTFPEGILTATYTTDGRGYLVGRMDGAVQRWDRDSCFPRFELRGPGPTTALAVSPDGRRFLHGSYSGLLWVRDADTGTADGDAVRYRGAVAAQYSPDGEAVVVKTTDRVFVLDAHLRQPSSEQSRSGYGSAMFFPSGDKLLVMTGGQLEELATDGRHPGRPVRFHPGGGVDRFAISCDGRTALTSDQEVKPARVWDVTTGKLLGPAPGAPGARPVSFSPDGRLLAVGTRDGRISFGELPRPLKGNAERIGLWAESITGMELDEEGVIFPLSPDTRAERTRLLGERGGPPQIPPRPE